MTTIIDHIVNDHLKKKAWKDEQKRTEWESKTALNRTRFIEWLGRDVYDLLSPKASEEVSLQNGAAVIEWKLPVDHDLKLAPMKIFFSTYSRQWCWISTAGYTIMDPQIGLVTSREQYEEYVEKERERRIEKLSQDLQYYQHDRELMEVSYAALILEFPERSEEWEKALKSWTEYHEERRREQEEQERQEAEHRENTVKYIEAYRAYRVDLEKVEAHNDRLLATTQARNNKPYTVYLLTYGVVGSTEDGDRYVETRQVYVKRDIAAGDKYYETMDGAKVQYLHPVSIERLHVRPTDRIAGSINVLVLGDIYIYFSPDTPQDVIDRETKGFLSLPEEPNPLDYGLTYAEATSLEMLAGTSPE
jgi:hypothetical protein